MRHILILALFFITLQNVAFSQTAAYSVKPGTYSEINPYGKNLYLVSKGNQFGIINGEGKVIVPVEASHITGFYDGLALVLKSEAGKQKVLGILSSNGNYQKISGNYYAIPYQEFFSEGFLTVTNDDGKAGFMNPRGVIVKEFNDSYVSPFSEGFAVVGENQNYKLIDSRFTPLNIQLGTVADIYGGTNVYKGNAIVWDGNAKFYTYNVNTGKAKKISKPKSLSYDYLLCFVSESQRPETVVYDETEREPLTLQAQKKDGKYGFEKAGSVILPYQFEQAEDFYGDFAIIRDKGQYGIIQYKASGKPFAVAPVKEEIKYKKSSSKNIKHNFELSVPDNINSDNLRINLKDSQGRTFTPTENNGVYEFTADAEEGKGIYGVEIEADGLKLWEGELAFTYVPEKAPVEIFTGNIDSNSRIAPLAVSLQATRTHADKDDLCSVTATISNPNSTAISAKVNWTGSSLLVGSGTTVTVPAKGATKVNINLKVLKARSGEKVTVTTSAGGSATIEGLQLIPFN